MRPFQLLTERSQEGAAAPEPEWMRRGRIPGLDGLRAISIALVFVEHVCMANFPASPKFLLGVGHTGVSMFFAISGFLITWLLLKEWGKTGSVSMKGFYIRRSLRILPAYFVFLAVMFALATIGFARIGARDWTAALTYTMNFVENPGWELGHLWSLSVEEQFYFMWPLTLLLLAPRRAPRALAAYLVLAPLVRFGIWLLARQHLGFIEYFTPLWMDSIASGCLLALLATNQRFRAMTRVTERQSVAITLLAALGLAGSYALSRVVTAYGVTFYYSFNSLCMVTIIWMVANHSRSMAGRVLETRPFIAVGVLSYSLYIWQQIFINPHHQHFTTAFPLNVLLVFMVATFSYVVIESPMLRLKDRFSAESASMAVTSRTAGSQS